MELAGRSGALPLSLSRLVETGAFGSAELTCVTVFPVSLDGGSLGAEAQEMGRESLMPHPISPHSEGPLAKIP